MKEPNGDTNWYLKVMRAIPRLRRSNRHQPYRRAANVQSNRRGRQPTGIRPVNHHQPRLRQLTRRQPTRVQPRRACREPPAEAQPEYARLAAALRPVSVQLNRLSMSGIVQINIDLVRAGIQRELATVDLTGTFGIIFRLVFKYLHYDSMFIANQQHQVYHIVRGHRIGWTHADMEDISDAFDQMFHVIGWSHEDMPDFGSALQYLFRESAEPAEPKELDLRHDFDAVVVDLVALEDDLEASEEEEEDEHRSELHAAAIMALYAGNIELPGFARPGRYDNAQVQHVRRRLTFDE